MILSGAISERLQTGMHLDMTASGDHVDTSTASPTLADGETFLAWVKPSQLGSSGHQIYPGLVAGGLDNYDDYGSLAEQSGTVITSGSTDVKIRIETVGGSVLRSAQFSMTIGTWYLLGWSFASDGSVTFFLNDSTLAVDYNDYAGGSTMNLNLHGYGYGGATDDGSGGKSMDAPGRWARELTATEVGDWYNSGIVPDTPANLWHYDDDSDATTALDSAGSADGTINGCAYVEGDAAP